MEFRDDCVRRVLADGRVEEVRWDDLAEVRLITTADGPFAEDVFFVLVGLDGLTGCMVPHSVADDGFIQRLQSLPGFDNEALIRAMSSAAENEFLLWRAM